MKESSFDSSNTLTSEYYYIRDKDSTYLAKVYIDTIGIINKRQNIGEENISFYRTYIIIDTTEQFKSNIYYYYNNTNQLISYFISNQYHNTSQITVKHDSLGREVEYIHKKNNYELYKELTIYHDSLNQYQIFIYENGNLDSHTIYKKNNKKLIYKIIQTEYYNPSFDFYSPENKTQQTINIYLTDFIYDFNNNWIIKTEHQNGKKSRIIKRKFEY